MKNDFHIQCLLVSYIRVSHRAARNIFWGCHFVYQTMAWKTMRLRLRLRRMRPRSSILMVAAARCAWEIKYVVYSRPFAGLCLRLDWNRNLLLTAIGTRHMWSKGLYVTDLSGVEQGFWCDWFVKCGARVLYGLHILFWHWYSRGKSRDWFFICGARVFMWQVMPNVEQGFLCGLTCSHGIGTGASCSSGVEHGFLEALVH